jgi:hypothetical protein
MTDPVTPDQAAEVLKIASAYDGRKPSELQATVWAADLTDARVSTVDAAQAVRRHYTDRPDVYVKPGHVIAIVREANADREERERTRRMLDSMPQVGSGPSKAGGELRRLTAEHMAKANAGRDPRDPPRVGNLGEILTAWANGDDR